MLLALWLLHTTTAKAAELLSVFEDNVHQFTGVAISKTGRMFVNYPRWETPHQYDVVEVSNGAVRPFPDEDWNSWEKGQDGSHKWVCVQAVWIDDQDNLWVVDPAAPGMKTVEDNSAKLVKIDLRADRVARVYDLSAIAGKKTYLNDVRIDSQTKTAYLTESQNGGLVVVDLTSGNARLLLAKQKPVLSDPGHTLTIDGSPLLREGKPMKVNSDGIALSPDRQWLYFKPLSDKKLYRVRTADLRNPDLTPRELASRVRDLGAMFTACDGMIFDPKGNLYMGDLENNAIMRVPRDLRSATVIEDKRLLWPDTFSWFPDGALCVTCSQIQNMASCHDGLDTRTTPYVIYKLKMD